MAHARAFQDFMYGVGCIQDALKHAPVDQHIYIADALTDLIWADSESSEYEEAMQTLIRALYGEN